MVQTPQHNHGRAHAHALQIKRSTRQAHAACLYTVIYGAVVQAACNRSVHGYCIGGNSMRVPPYTVVRVAWATTPSLSALSTRRGVHVAHAHAHAHSHARTHAHAHAHAYAHAHAHAHAH